MLYKIFHNLKSKLLLQYVEARQVEMGIVMQTAVFEKAREGWGYQPILLQQAQAKFDR